jgi:hypothetical protein
MQGLKAQTLLKNVLATPNMCILGNADHFVSLISDRHVDICCKRSSEVSKEGWRERVSRLKLMFMYLWRTYYT